LKHLLGMLLIIILILRFDYIVIGTLTYIFFRLPTFLKIFFVDLELIFYENMKMDNVFE